VGLCDPASGRPPVLAGPALGRGFSAETDRKGAAHEVILTDRIWKREFSSNPRILGQTTTLDGRTYTR